MSETQIQETLAAFEAEFGMVNEAEGFVVEMKSGCDCCGCCDYNKCTIY